MTTTVVAQALLEVARKRTSDAVACLEYGAKSRAVEFVAEAEEALADAKRRIQEAA